MNIYPINNKTDIFWRNFELKKKFLKKVFTSYSEQDPLFHETDLRRRIHIQMKRIRNTVLNILHLLYFLYWDLIHWYRVLQLICNAHSPRLIWFMI